MGENQRDEPYSMQPRGAPVTDVRQAHVQEAANQISAVIERVFASLAEMRDSVLALHGKAQAAGAALRSDDLAQLRPLLFDHLDTQRPLIAGTGYICAPNVLADAPRWLEWWESTPGNDHRFLDVDLDPDSVDFYDYTAAEWFEVPQRTRERVIVGPYVDYGGTDAYMLTLTMPVIAPGAFLGVAGADVPAGGFEAAVLPVLRKVAAEAALLNSAGRIIASNTPRKVQGSLLKAPRRGRPSPPAPEWDGVVTNPCPGLPWVVVTFPERPAVSR